MTPTYDACWLKYDRLPEGKLRDEWSRLSRSVYIAGNSPLVLSAKDELKQALRSMTGQEPQFSDRPDPSSLLIGKREDDERFANVMHEQQWSELNEDGFVIRSDEGGRLVLVGKTDTGVLYGVFRLLALIAGHREVESIDETEQPQSGIRMINHWDNMDGSIERGYAGGSIYYKNYRFDMDEGRIRDYARLLASVGINAVSINNVNVHETETKLITSEWLPDVAHVADMFRRYGIATYLSINFAAPVQIGGLNTADPLDNYVCRWWEERARDIYRHIPDFGGFVVKADSENRPGPFTYGRGHAEGANMLARALKPYGGTVVWRCFVYNCHQDWRDRSTDRARAAYDHFKPLDGQFDDNVVLEIKNGPMDFQVREPVSPLFGALQKTGQLLELQITQEYTGQQRHLCYLVPQWKEVLDFDTYARGEGSEVKKVINGTDTEAKRGGMAAVVNVGEDEFWTGHPLAQANLYGYGRLAWNADLSAELIAREWIALTFGHDPQVTDVIADMMMKSWPIYENYTAPLGIGWMVNPNHHYGPNVDGYEYSKWGTYHFADRDGIGVDRTKATGTGYSQQYFEPNASMYDSPDTCPDELLLFFHHVPYKHKLKSGKTVIQHIYDTHFEGAEQAKELLDQWTTLEGKVEHKVYQRVLERLEHQAEHAKEWRDQINTYFYRKSGIADARGRTIY